MRRAALFTFVAVLAFAAAALAYTRSVTNLGKPVFWPASCAYIQADTADATDLTASDLDGALGRGIANWKSVDSGCSYFTIQQDPPGASETVPDYRNVVKFRTGNPAAGAHFCRPASKEDAGFTTDMVCYDDSATAITTVFYTSNPGKSNDGAIWDADIELNDIDFTFVLGPTVGSLVPRPGTTFADLENTLTHELGHFQGLDHTCWDMVSTPTAPLDGNGKPIPACSNVGKTPATCKIDQTECNTIINATMYNYASPGEISKRMPKADDIAGICAIYPIGHDPNTCVRAVPAPKGGCSLAPASAQPSEWFALLLSALFLLGAAFLARQHARLT